MPKVVFKDIEEASMPTVYANSVIGSIGPRGDLILYLCQEYPEFPVAKDADVSSDGHVIPDPNPARPEAIRITRKKMIRVVLPITQLPSIADWLKTKASELTSMGPIRESVGTQQDEPRA